MMRASPPYAVIFKAFTIDRFVLRQLARVRSLAAAGEVYVMMDETKALAGDIPFGRVIRYQESDLLALGFASHAQGSLFWYNADYPLYYFHHLHPEYDVIIMLEYDAVPQVSLDLLARECRDGGWDFIAQPIHRALDSYWWTASMRYFYQPYQIRPFLLCAAAFSSRAVRHLASQRLRQGRDVGLLSTAQWPVGEAYVGTELALRGFKLRELATFGPLSRYDWWPPVHESELPDLSAEAFIHPVLNGRRYIGSLFKNGNVTGLVAMVRLNLARVMAVMLARRVWRAARDLLDAAKEMFPARR